MNTNEYLNQSEVTEKKFPEGRFFTQQEMEILHHVMGMVTEAGELMDALKKAFIYGKELDLVNLKEEAGDTLWYVAGLIRNLKTSFEDVAQVNIDKLKARYGDKFSEYAALNRDLEKERSILNG